LPEDLEGLDEATLQFLRTQKPSTRHTYKSFFRKFLEFTSKTGAELIAEKKSQQNYEMEQKVLEFKNWMMEKKHTRERKVKVDGKITTRVETYGYSKYGAKTAVAVVRAFFLHNRIPLSFLESEKKKINKASRETADYKFTLEDIAKMNLVADLKEKYVLLMGKSLGLRSSDFIRLTYGHFRSIDLNKEPPISLGEVSTIKEDIKAQPFVDADALPIIRMILEGNPEAKNNQRILKIRGEQLSETIKRLVQKANIATGDKQVRFHCLRKFLIDRLSAITSESKWKQVVGKAISEEAYVSDEELAESYAKVMKLTCIGNNNGGTKTRVEELEKTVSALMEQINRNTEERAEEISQIKDYEKRLKDLEAMVLRLLSEKLEQKS
jgi:integrase